MNSFNNNIIKGVSIVSWNCQGMKNSKSRRNKQSQLQLFCDQHQPAAILLQDHRLSPHDQLKVYGYTVHYVNRYLINIVSNKYQYKPIQQHSIDKARQLQMSAFQIKFNDRHDALMICIVYYHPRNELTMNNTDNESVL
jgi:hypothetical protein